MATFKPGQRVKDITDSSIGTFVEYLPRPDWDCIVRFDKSWENICGTLIPASVPALCKSGNLVPLTDPGEKSLTCQEVLELTGLPEFSIPLPVPVIVTHGDAA